MAQGFTQTDTGEYDAGDITIDPAPPTPDISPAPFGWPSQTGWGTDEVTTSTEETPESYDTPSEVTVDIGLFSVGGDNFSATPRDITPGQTLTLRHTSSSTPGGSVIQSATIGGVVGTFQTTTFAASSGDSLPRNDPACKYFSDFVNIPELNGQGYQGGEVHGTQWLSDNTYNLGAGSGYVSYQGGNLSSGGGQRYTPATGLDTPDSQANAGDEAGFEFILCSNRPEMQGSPIGLSDGEEWGFDQRYFNNPLNVDENFTMKWAGASQIYYRMYFKFLAGFKFPRGQLKFLGHFGEAAKTTGQISCNFRFSPWGTPDANGLLPNASMAFNNIYRTSDTTNKEGSQWWFADPVNEAAIVQNFTPNIDQWYDLEVMVKQSTIEGVANDDGNGQCAVWVDGVQRFLKTDLNNKNLVTNLLNSTLLGAVYQTNGGTPGDGYPPDDGTMYHLLQKNVQVATVRIGYDR